MLGRRAAAVADLREALRLEKGFAQAQEVLERVDHHLVPLSSEKVNAEREAKTATRLGSCGLMHRRVQVFENRVDNCG